MFLRIGWAVYVIVAMTIVVLATLWRWPFGVGLAMVFALLPVGAWLSKRRSHARST